jgi:hypothetical protein
MGLISRISETNGTMGVSIHYRGKLSDIRKIKVLCDELALISDKMGWACTRLEEDWSKPADATIEITDHRSQIIGHLPLKGIAFTINPKCESLQFFFDAKGYLRDPMSMVQISKGNMNTEDSWVSIKTQFAGPVAHIWIVGLLKYLKEHYLSDLEVRDEGEYWETENFGTLKEKMNLINEKLDAVTGELSRVTGHHIERLSADDIASMIEAVLINRFDTILIESKKND